jgi:diketogulonate reductase-like aldo/keto reductase
MAASGTDEHAPAARCSPPPVGFGCWKVANDEAAATVCQAIERGYRHLDCAADYGNEREVGEGIRMALEKGFIKDRAELFVTSKLWCTDHRREHVLPALKRTLSDLGLEYVDLYLIHFPISIKHVDPTVRYPAGFVFDPSAGSREEGARMILDPVPVSETWGAMEALVDAGLARFIGLSNFNIQGVRDVLSYCRIPPAVLQVELHPNLQQNKLLRFCRESDIAVTAFSPLGAGSYVPLGTARSDESVLGHPVVMRLAEAHGRTPGQIVLRWGVQRGTSVVCKTSRAERLSENLSLFDFELTPTEMEEMSTLETGRRFNDPGVFCEPAFGTFCPIFE